MTRKKYEFELWFSDLRDEAQEQLLRTVSASFPEQMGWDKKPIRVLKFYFEEYS